MILCRILSVMFTIAFAISSWAADDVIIDVQPENAIAEQEEVDADADSKQTAAESEQECDESKDGCFKRKRAAIRAWRHRCLDKLGSTNGALLVAFIYGTSQCVSTTIWALNWAKRFGLTPELSADLQEIGGFSSAAETLLLYVVFTLGVQAYQNKHAGRNTAPAGS